MRLDICDCFGLCPGSLICLSLSHPSVGVAHSCASCVTGCPSARYSRSPLLEPHRISDHADKKHKEGLKCVFLHVSGCVSRIGRNAAILPIASARRVVCRTSQLPGVLTVPLATRQRRARLRKFGHPISRCPPTEGARWMALSWSLYS